MTFKQRLQQHRQQQNNLRSPTPPCSEPPSSPPAANKQELPADPEDAEFADDDDQAYEEECDQPEEGPEDLIQLNEPEPIFPAESEATAATVTGPQPMDILN